MPRLAADGEVLGYGVRRRFQRVEGIMKKLVHELGRRVILAGGKFPTSANRLGLAWCRSQMYWPEGRGVGGRIALLPGQTGKPGGGAEVVEKLLDTGRRLAVRSKLVAPGRPRGALGMTIKAPWSPITRFTGVFRLS